MKISEERTRDQQMTLTPREAAQILKVRKKSIYELIRQKKLEGFRVGRQIRILLSDLETYIRFEKSKELNS